MTDLPRPLDGIRVLAPEQVIAGPYGSMILSAFGADVIRVERPPNGDMYRNNPPYIENEHGRTGYGLLANNLNKRSIALDLQLPEAQEIFRQLAAKVDVVWENNRPGVMDRLGLGYEAIRAINPRIIYVSVSGFGQTWSSKSPYSHWPAFDIVAQAMGGLLMRAGNEGDPPIYNGFALGDQYPSVMATIGCLLALRWRDQTGQGTHVDISMYDATASLMNLVLSAYTFDPRLARRGALATSYPYGAFACADGYFVLAVAGDVMWQRFCKILERPDLLADETLKTGSDRAQRSEYIKGIIEEWAADKTREEVVPTFIDAGIPAGPVRDVGDLLECPHLAARDMIAQVDDPVTGPRPVMSVPIRFSHAPAPRTDPPPQFGQDGADILHDLLGLSSEDIARLRESGVLHGR